MVSTTEHVGIVVIGRNEGERLGCCLDSLAELERPVVYVDSGSIDGSVSLAHSMSFRVVELDPSEPFTAARARNAGFKSLLETNPSMEFVQFMDGDCEMAEGWLEHGLAQIRTRADVAVVCGRVCEQHPEVSVYNRLCDIEWNLPLGEIDACGGVMLVRTEALQRVGGFDATVIAAEDTELCSRLRLQGWKIIHVEADMARHDAAITHASQWWKRCMRAGYCLAQFSSSRGNPAHGFFRRGARSVWFWGCLLPVMVVALAWPSRGLTLVLLAGYPLLAYRVYRRERRKQTARLDAAAYALHCILGKFAQIIGVLKYRSDRLRNRRGAIIEHKGPRLKAGSKTTPGQPVRSNEKQSVGVVH